MSLTDRVHESYVHSRRVRVLSELVAAQLPREATLLDVGCGDGLLARAVMGRRPDVSVRGIDVLVRGDTHVPVAAVGFQTVLSSFFVSILGMHRR